MPKHPSGGHRFATKEDLMSYCVQHNIHQTFLYWLAHNRITLAATTGDDKSFLTADSFWTYPEYVLPHLQSFAAYADYREKDRESDTVSSTTLIIDIPLTEMKALLEFVKETDAAQAIREPHPPGTPPPSTGHGADITWIAENTNTETFRAPAGPISYGTRACA